MRYVTLPIPLVVYAVLMFCAGLVGFGSFAQVMFGLADWPSVAVGVVGGLVAAYGVYDAADDEVDEENDTAESVS